MLERLEGTRILLLAVPAVASALVAVSKIPATVSLAAVLSIKLASLFNWLVPILERLEGTSALSVAVPAVASALVAISILPATVSLAAAISVIKPESLLKELRLIELRAVATAWLDAFPKNTLS